MKTNKSNKINITYTICNIRSLKKNFFPLFAIPIAIAIPATTKANWRIKKYSELPTDVNEK